MGMSSTIPLLLLLYWIGVASAVTRLTLYGRRPPETAGYNHYRHKYTCMRYTDLYYQFEIKIILRDRYARKIYTWYTLIFTTPATPPATALLLDGRVDERGPSLNVVRLLLAPKNPYHSTQASSAPASGRHRDGNQSTIRS